MMDEVQLLRRYGKRSAPEAGVDVDVSGRVLQTLRSRQIQEPTASLRTLVVVAAASWVAVLATGIWVQEAWAALADPVASLVSPFVVTMQ